MKLIIGFFGLLVMSFSHWSLANTKYIDLRVKSEAFDYEVHFCYRPSPGYFGKPGHAYAAFAKKDNNSKKIQFRAFGATTKGITDIFGGDGYIKPEYQSHMYQNCLIVQVNSELYNAAWNQAKPLFSEPEYAYWNYHITDNSCVDYARRIARSIGLKVNNNNTPDAFIAQLQENNR